MRVCATCGPLTAVQTSLHACNRPHPSPAVCAVLVQVRNMLEKLAATSKEEAGLVAAESIVRALGVTDGAGFDALMEALSSDSNVELRAKVSQPWTALLLSISPLICLTFCCSRSFDGLSGNFYCVSLVADVCRQS